MNRAQGNDRSKRDREGRRMFGNGVLLGLGLCLSLAMTAGCAGSKGGSNATASVNTAPTGLPAAAPAGPVNSYSGFQTQQIWSATFDDSKNTFSYQRAVAPQATTPATTVSASGATRLVNGFLDLGQTAGVTNGYALEIPGRSVMLRPGDMTTPLVILSGQPSKCLPIGGGISFEFMSMPDVSSGSDVALPVYGVISALSNSDGAALSFVGQTQYSGAGTIASGPYPSLFAATCSASSGGAAITVPPTVAFPQPIDVSMGPTGYFNLAYNYGASAGFLQPAAPIDAKALTSAKFLGFRYTAANGEPSSVMPIAFGVQSDPSGSLAGGEFPGDDITQTPNAEYTITLGTQSTTVNGLYESATFEYPLPPLGCPTPGKDPNGDPVCIDNAVAIAGLTEGKYSLFVMDGNTAYFLYQTSAMLVLPVAVSIAQAPPAFLYTSSTLSLSAAVTNDPANAGVDWTVSCGGQGVCGSISPAHTASGGAATYTAPATVPPGNAVTVTATSTTDHLKSATITLNIEAPVGISFSTAPPSTLLIGSKAPVAATVTNDPAAQGVDWTLTCGTAGSCGSLASAHTAGGAANSFTAPSTVPAGGTVTITATSTSDKTKQVSAAVRITLPPISIAFNPAPFSSQAVGFSQSITATVANDPAGKGVDWTVTCGTAGACGSFAPAHTASGAATTFSSPAAIPSGGTVTVTATSSADPTKSVSTAITITAKPEISVVLSTPPPASLQASVPATLAASIANDPQNLGVDWTATCASTGAGDCGTFSASHTASGANTTYTAPSAVPSGGTVTVTATSTADPTKSAAAAVTILARVEVPLAGKVLAGGNPVAGAAVSLYTPGTNGYATTASLLSGPITTDTNGAFSMPSTYNCPTPTSPVYLLSVGGDAGGGPNSALTLMSALGACNSLGSSTLIHAASLTVNEATTVASVYALSAFMSSGTSVGASATNTQGIGIAFAQTTNLVNLSTGSALAKTPAGNGAVPQAEIDTLANLLSACAATNGSSTACSGLFANATPSGGAAPTDTVTALWNISRNPGSNVGAIYALAPANGPHQPALTAAPLSWVMPVTYTGAGLIQTREVQIDAQGNVWAININNASIPDGNPIPNQSLSKLSPLGVPLSPNATSSSGGGFTAASLGEPFSLSIDPAGDAWVYSNGPSANSQVNAITEFAADGTLLTPPGGLQAGGIGVDYTSATALAIDGLGDAWLSSSTFTAIGDGLIKLSNAGFALSPENGYEGGGLIAPQQIAFDGSDNAWALNRPGAGSFNIVEFANDGTALSPATGFNPPNFYGATAIAIDGYGHVWATNTGFNITGALIELGKDGTTLSPADGYPIPNAPSLMAIDGAGSVWVTANGIYQFANNGTLLSPAGSFYTGISAGVAIDGSGNVWGSQINGGLYDSNGNYLGDPLTELVGAATPVVTPISSAAGMNMVAARP